MEQLGSDLSSMLSGNFVNRFNIDGRSYKVIPQIARAGRLTADAAGRHLRHRARAAGSIPLSAVATIQTGVEPRIAEPVPAAERDQDLRRCRRDR